MNNDTFNTSTNRAYTIIPSYRDCFQKMHFDVYSGNMLCLTNFHESEKLIYDEALRRYMADSDGTDNRCTIQFREAVVSHDGKNIEYPEHCFGMWVSKDKHLLNKFWDCFNQIKPY